MQCVPAPVLLGGVENETDQHIGDIVVDGKLEHHADHLLRFGAVSLPLAELYGDGLIDLVAAIGQEVAGIDRPLQRRSIYSDNDRDIYILFRE